MSFETFMAHHDHNFFFGLKPHLIENLNQNYKNIQYSIIQ